MNKLPTWLKVLLIALVVGGFTALSQILLWLDRGHAKFDM